MTAQGFAEWLPGRRVGPQAPLCAAKCPSHRDRLAVVEHMRGPGWLRTGALLCRLCAHCDTWPRSDS